MDFIEKLRHFSDRIDSVKETIQTEEATKTSIIMPFFAMLGYDVFNPREFMPEYTADVGIKKGEKVDYAILFDNIPTILIEAKSINENLNKHGSQLFRYFGTSEAKFAILTNGIIYKFFTDLDDLNKMDEKPFLEINMLDIKEYQIAELKKFTKDNFNVDEIFSVASDLKYSNEFKTIISNEMSTPTDDFIKFFLNKAYDGRQTQAIIDKFKPVLKKSLNSFVNELMSDKIKIAFDNTSTSETQTLDTVINDEIIENKIITTPEELEAYFIVKQIASSTVPLTDIKYKDNERYMAIYFAKTNNWICRLHFNSAKKYIIVPDSTKKPIRFDIETIYDINNYSTEILEALSRYL